MHTYPHTHACTHTRMHSHTHTHTHACTHTHTHIHTHAHMHAHAHTHTHTQESTEVDRSTSCKELKRQLRDLSNIRLPTAQNTSRCMTNHSLSTTHDLSAGLSFNKMTSDQVIDVTSCLRAEDVHRLNREKVIMFKINTFIIDWLLKLKFGNNIIIRSVSP